MDFGFLFIERYLTSLLLMFVPLTLGAVEYKLFVGSLNKQATEKEVEEVSHLHYLLYPFLKIGFFKQRFFSHLVFPFHLKLIYS